jgi:hypothetical protein
MKRPQPKYSPKASEKVARTMHEFKRGKLRSGGGGKVTSREQAIAIGLAQARRAGYKTPPLPRGHAAMNLDARVRAYLGAMQPGTEIDARGVARALGSGDLEADYALERAAKAGLAVTSDGRWFGPGGGQPSHSRKTQLDREINEALARPNPDTIKLKDRYSGGGHVWLTISDGRIIGVMGSDPGRYMGMTLEEAKRYARHGGARRVGRAGSGSHATIKLDRDDARMFGRYARRMDQTRAQALANARSEGFTTQQLGAVEEGWEAERLDTEHGGFTDTSD